MKAIIIEEDRFNDILDKFKLIKEEGRETDPNMIHRQYHFELVRWAQSHGASCLKT